MEPLERLEIKAGSWTFDALAAGPSDGELVLLLHGFPETSYEWRHQLGVLAAAGYRALAPDQRGYSPRARPGDVQAYAVDHLGSDVLAIADELGGHRVHLVGHDWGAAVAWYVAGRWPERLRTLTSLSVPHPQAFAAAHRGDLGGDQKERSSYMEFFRQEGVAEDALLPRMRGMLSGAGLDDEAVAAHLRVVGEREGLTGGLNWYRANRIETIDVPVVDVPTLFVWSDADPYLGREAAEATERFVTGPYRFEVLEGVDHWIPEKAGERVTALLLDHLRGHRSA